MIGGLVYDLNAVGIGQGWICLGVKQWLIL